jgi:hypothetical protein
MRSTVLWIGSVLAFIIAVAYLPQNTASAGMFASCGGAAASASCSGTAEVAVRRAPVRQLFGKIKERRAARVSASCSGSYTASCSGN